MVRPLRKALILLLLPLMAQPLSAQDKSEQKDSLVRLMKASSLRLIDEDGRTYRKTVDATFLHNGTYLICDTALWDVDNKIINAFGHVQIIQDETILTSDKLDYFIDRDLAEFRGGIVQLQNKKLNTLRTRHLDYNTKDSVAIFKNGGAMRDQDGQIIEGLEGTYDSALKIFTFNKDVDMFTDSAFVKTEYLEYYSERNRAEFPKPIDFWKEENMLSASRGWYDRGRETFFFRNQVHALGETQEAWTDTLYYYRTPNNLEMHGVTQMQDESRDVASLSNYVFYDDSLSRVILSSDAAVALFSDTDKGRDTLYIGGDILIYETIRMCDIPRSELDGAEKRLHDIFVDPVSEYRAKAAQDAEAKAKAAADEAAKNDPALAAKKKAEDMRAAAEMAKEQAPSEPEKTEPAEEEKLEPKNDFPEQPGNVPDPDEGLLESPVGVDSLALQAADSTVAAVMSADSTVALSMAADSTVAAVMPVDSTAAPVELPDTTKVGFVTGIGNVMVFRDDIQARCDSLRYNDLDSIARLYKNPRVWNEIRRQYISDSLFVLVRDGGVDRASLLSNAYIMVQEDSSAFDQIKGAEVMAYFDKETNLKRFDALGGASAIFYLEEDDYLATVNKVASRMLSATLKDGEVERVYYYDAPKNDAYPRAQVNQTDSRMKGFEWTPELRPRGKEDITSLTLRPSERESYLKRRRPTFVQTEKYFPGYMKKIYGEIAVRDSIRRLPPPVEPEVLDTLSALDSLAMRPVIDTTLVPVFSDSLKMDVTDTLALADTLAQKPAVDPFAEERLQDELSKTPEEKAAEEMEAKKAAAAAALAARKAARKAAIEKRVAEQEARWARLDSLDSLKVVAKEKKVLEKKREKTRKELIKKARQDKKDQAKLDKYIKRYERKKAREERRKRSSGSHPVFSVDGTADDGPVLRSGGIPRP